MEANLQCINLHTTESAIYPLCQQGMNEEYYENEEYGGLTDDSVETYFTRAGSKPSGNFSRGRPVFQRGRVIKGRGE